MKQLFRKSEQYRKIALASLVLLSFASAVRSSSSGILAGATCVAQGFTTDGVMQSLRTCEYYAPDGNCCSYQTGMALCTTDYYVNNEYFTSDSYYAQIYQVQQTMACGYPIS